MGTKALIKSKSFFPFIEVIESVYYRDFTVPVNAVPLLTHLNQEKNKHW